MARRSRVTIREASEYLDTSVDAIRKRIARGTLDSDKDPDGRVYVYLDDDQDGGQTVSPDDSHLALLKAKDETIDLLCQQLEEEREARRRADTIILNMTEALKALEAPPEAPREPSESPVTVSEDLGNGRGRESDTEQEKRSWWWRLFGY